MMVACWQACVQHACPRQSDWHGPHHSTAFAPALTQAPRHPRRQEQAAAADDLESAAHERRGCEQKLLQHARASSREQRRRSEALAGQLARVQARAAQLLHQCQVER